MNNLKLPRQGLYAITPEFKSASKLINDVKLAIKGGAVMIQYRDKNNSSTKRREIATQLLTLCNENSVPLIINDDIELANSIGAHGVHIGKDDCKLAEAKAKLPKNSIIGVTCYNNIARAVEAEKQGASYVAFGRFFASKSKPEASTAELEILTQAKQQLSIPITAIGGISPDNATQALKAGADLLAVINAIFNSTTSPEHTAQKITSLCQFKRNNTVIKL